MNHDMTRLARPVWTLTLLAAGLLAGCATPHDESSRDAASQDAYVKYRWVVLGDGGLPVARAATGHASCPLVTVDGASRRMTLRAAAGTVAQRATASSAADSKPSTFALGVCEATLPADARQASIGGHALPLPKAAPQRILVLGDTGCRVKKADNTFQSCNDPVAWPLAQIAAVAARMQPDLVLHVGDYHYRENACPDDIGGCRGTPWGYGGDTWEADLFVPAAPLLAAAPWIVVRGNHEECRRAGQGWFRFLDPAPYRAARSCDDPAADATADYSAPYAVPLGAGYQVIVFDSARAGRKPLALTDPQFIAYRQDFEQVGRLAAKPGTASIFVNHHQILGYVPIAGGAPIGALPSLLGVMASRNGQAYYPAGVALALHGHVHDFQAMNFASDHPATVVSGNGGDNLDVALPDPFPADFPPAPGVVLDRITHSTTFGFMLMERAGADWTYKAYARDGRLMTTCAQAGRHLVCDRTGFLAG